MTQMTWQRLLDPSRLHGERSGRDEIGRSPFHKDHDRIVFAGSFRRLGARPRCTRSPTMIISTPA